MIHYDVKFNFITVSLNMFIIKKKLIFAYSFSSVARICASLLITGFTEEKKKL